MFVEIDLVEDRCIFTSILSAERPPQVMGLSFFDENEMPLQHQWPLKMIRVEIEVEPQDADGHRSPKDSWFWSLNVMIN